MSSSNQDYYGNWPRKVATGRAAERQQQQQLHRLKSAKSMDSLGLHQQQLRPATSAPPTVPRIDLTNFDSPEFDGLDYVLTSPRSLEACQRLGFRPVQLLYRRLQEFELENPGLPVAKLFELYDKHEAQRKEGLRLARQERDRLILLALGDDGGGGGIGGLSASTPDLLAAKPRSSKTAAASAPGTANEDAVSSNWELQVRRELADHEDQAERLRLRLENQRLRRLAESKARRERERQLADQTRRHADKLQARTAAPACIMYSAVGTPEATAGDGSGILQQPWEERRREAESRRAAWERQTAEAVGADLRVRAESLDRAQRARSSRESHANHKRHQRLRRKEEAHRERADSLRRAATREAVAERETADRRMRDATKNAELALEKRQLSLKEQQMMQLERYRSSAERRKLLEAEIDEYKEELRRYRQLAEQRAEDTVNRRSQQLAHRAAAKEAQRQAVARRNQREQERADESWRRRVEAQAVAKQQEVERQQEAKERERQNSRAVAESGARLRESVRRGSDSFDKKVAQVNLVNKLGLGHEIK